MNITENAAEATENATRSDYYDFNGNLTENKQDAYEIYELDANAQIGGIWALAMGQAKLVASKRTGLNLEMF